MATGERIQVIDLRNGTVYPSVKAASKALHLDWSNMYHAKAEGRKNVGGIPLKFVPSSDPINAKPCLCVETGKIFPSRAAAGKSVNRNPKDILQAIQMGYRCGGYHWKEVEE